MKKKIIILIIYLSGCCCSYPMLYGQNIELNLTPAPTLKMGFGYCKGIMWTENTKQDSIIDIIIDTDTMTAIRNLLIYCLQEKEKADYAGIILSMINLDKLRPIFNDTSFDFYVNEYKKTLMKNKKYRDRVFPENKHN